MRTVLLTALVLLAWSCGKQDPDSKPVPDKETDEVFTPGKDKMVLINEVRGAWLTTVGGYDWPDGETDPERQKKDLVDMIAQLKAEGMNTIYFQVCCNSDAMWPSKILPWSRDLTGTTGKDPGYDPLELAVRTAHENDMEIHAWLNPLRVGAASRYQSNDYCLAHSDRIRQYTTSAGSTTYYWDPGYPEVRRQLRDVVTELLGNYDLDGIHIDDYFYPDGMKENPNDWDDTDSYSKYGEGCDIDEWRYSNINAIVKTLYETTHRNSVKAVFGVSPSGRLVNTRRLYADPEMWVKEGSLDYLAPQIYWPHGHPTADFFNVLQSWKGVIGNVPLIPGLAAYRLGESGFNNSEFLRQVEECRECGYATGNIWFRVKVKLFQGDLFNYIQGTIYKYGSLVPELRPVEGSAPAIPVVRRSGTTISWDRIDGADEYVVYLLQRKNAYASNWYAWVAARTKDTSFKGEKGKNYVVLAASGKKRSPVSGIVHIPVGQ